MRETINDKVAYFEKDLMAYALPARAMKIYEEPKEGEDRIPAPVTASGECLLACIPHACECMMNRVEKALTTCMQTYYLLRRRDKLAC